MAISFGRATKSDKKLACDGCIDSALTGHGFGCGFTFVRVPDGLAGN